MMRFGNGNCLRVSLGIVFCAMLAINVGPIARAQTSPYVADCNAYNTNTDLTVSAYYYTAGYLECLSVDSNTSGNYVLKESSIGSGSFTLLVGGGGGYSVGDLISEGVPASVAPILWLGFGVSENARRYYGTEPRSTPSAAARKHL